MWKLCSATRGRDVSLVISPSEKSQSLYIELYFTLAAVRRDVDWRTVALMSLTKSCSSQLGFELTKWNPKHHPDISSFIKNDLSSSDLTTAWTGMTVNCVSCLQSDPAPLIPERNHLRSSTPTRQIICWVTRYEGYWRVKAPNQFTLLLALWTSLSC